MRKVSTGRFERLECQKCGAHVRVPAPATPKAQCEVCGSSELVTVQERPPRAEGLRDVGIRHEPDRAQRG
jgi:rRNA maturation endonuclease Nob1